MQRLRLNHPALGFWIDVRVGLLNGRWLAVADLAGEPEFGVGKTASESLWRALSPFGIVLRSDPVAEAEHQLLGA